MQWDWRTGGLVPAGPGPALPGGIAQGALTPILTDTQAERQKEAEKAARGGGLPHRPITASAIHLDRGHAHGGGQRPEPPR